METLADMRSGGEKLSQQGWKNIEKDRWRHWRTRNEDGGDLVERWRGKSKSGIEKQRKGALQDSIVADF